MVVFFFRRKTVDLLQRDGDLDEFAAFGCRGSGDRGSHEMLVFKRESTK